MADEDLELDDDKGGKPDDDKGGKPDDDKGGKPDDDKGGKSDDDKGGKPDDELTGWEAERVALAGEDEKMLKYLSRYGTKEEALKAGFNANNKLGEKVTIKGKPGEKATDGEILDYRKEMGIPEKWEDYDLQLDKGTVLGEGDKIAVDSFKEIAHKLNLSPDEVAIIAKHQLATQDKMLEDLAQKDAQAEIDCEAELSRDTVWGKEMTRNLNQINNLLDTAPEGVKDLLWGARLTDGTPLGSNPTVLRFLNTISRQINPMGTVVADKGKTADQTVNDRIKEIESKMGTDEYFKDEKMQKEYRELVDMREKNASLNK